MIKVSDVIKKDILVLELENGFQGIDKDVIIPPHIVKVVNYVFATFKIICVGFDKQFETDAEKINAIKTQWMIAFRDNNISNQIQIENALNKARISKPINIPIIGQFIEWCRPDLYTIGLEEPSKAASDAIWFHANNYRLPISKKNLDGPPEPCKKFYYKIIYNVLRNIDVQRFMKLPEKESLAIFEKEYYKVIDQWQAGFALIEIPALIQDKRKEKKNFDVAKMHLAKIKESLNFKASNNSVVERFIDVDEDIAAIF